MEGISEVGQGLNRAIHGSSTRLNDARVIVLWVGMGGRVVVVIVEVWGAGRVGEISYSDRAQGAIPGKHAS